ncbi:MAG: di-trans,poly-cis-decaprenylcistransferase [Phycisphaerales bacterium]|nr:di-trans,poly-cis-decaprenylcistransferase [Phycisphaerales bacterium]
MTGPTTLSDADRDALARMARLTPRAAPLEHLPDVPPARIPRHIAIIMDGNGRWARQRGLPHAAGHKRGAETVRRIVEECGRVGVEAITLYSFSSENWKRPREEIDALMQLCVAYCNSEREGLVREGVRVRVIGRTDELPGQVRDALGQLVEATSRVVGPTLCLAINYGSRREITDAVRALASRVRAGGLDPGDITEETITHALDTAGLPEPDLLIRTAGEMRVSNFLLWQISYAELFVTDTLWPDFGTPDFHGAIRAFASRVRRFGARPDTPADPPPAG